MATDPVELVDRLIDAEKDREIRSVIAQMDRDTYEMRQSICDVRTLQWRREQAAAKARKGRKPRIEKSMSKPGDASRFARIAAALIADNAIDLLHQFGRQEVKAGRLQPQTIGL